MSYSIYNTTSGVKVVTLISKSVDKKPVAPTTTTTNSSPEIDASIQVDLLINHCGNITDNNEFVGIAHLIEHLVWYTIDPDTINNAFTTSFSTAYTIESSSITKILKLIEERFFPYKNTFITKNIESYLNTVNLTNIFKELSNEFYFRCIKNKYLIDHLSVYSVNSSYPGGIYKNLSKEQDVKDKIVRMMRRYYNAENITLFVRGDETIVTKQVVDGLVSLMNRFEPGVNNTSVTKVSRPINIQHAYKDYNLISLVNNKYFHDLSNMNVLFFILDVNPRDKVMLLNAVFTLKSILNRVNQSLHYMNINLSSSFTTPNENTIIINIYASTNVRLEKLYYIVYMYLIYLSKSSDILSVVRGDVFNKSVDYYTHGNHFDLVSERDPTKLVICSEKEFKQFINNNILSNYHSIVNVATNSLIFEYSYYTSDMFGTEIRCSKVPFQKMLVDATIIYKNPFQNIVSTLDSIQTHTMTFSKNHVFNYTIFDSYVKYVDIVLKFVDSNTKRIINYSVNRCVMIYPSVCISVAEFINYYAIDISGALAIQFAVYLCTTLRAVYSSLSEFDYYGEPCYKIQDTVSKHLTVKVSDISKPSTNTTKSIKDRRVGVNKVDVVKPNKGVVYVDKSDNISTLFYAWTINIYGRLTTDETCCFTAFGDYYRNLVISVETTPIYNKDVQSFDCDISVVIVLLSADVLNTKFLNEMKDSGLYYAHERYNLSTTTSASTSAKKVIKSKGGTDVNNNDGVVVLYVIPTIYRTQVANRIYDFLQDKKIKYSIQHSNAKIGLH